MFTDHRVTLTLDLLSCSLKKGKWVETAVELVGGVGAVRARVAAPGGGHAARAVRARELVRAARRRAAALRRALLAWHACKHIFLLHIDVQ